MDLVKKYQACVGGESVLSHPRAQDKQTKIQKTYAGFEVRQYCLSSSPWQARGSEEKVFFVKKSLQQNLKTSSSRSVKVFSTARTRLLCSLVETSMWPQRTWSFSWGLRNLWIHVLSFGKPCCPRFTYFLSSQYLNWCGVLVLEGHPSQSSSWSIHQRSLLCTPRLVHWSSFPWSSFSLSSSCSPFQWFSLSSHHDHH